MTTRTLQFRVTLWPRGDSVTLTAFDVVDAAQKAQQRLGPANEATVDLVGGLTTEQGDVQGDAGPTDVWLSDRTACVHFVAFRSELDQDYASAVWLYGSPDFVHRHWDQRAQREIADYDLVVFARGSDADVPSRFNFDDSNEPHDPAARERRFA